MVARKLEIEQCQFSKLALFVFHWPDITYTPMHRTLLVSESAVIITNVPLWSGETNLSYSTTKHMVSAETNGFSRETME